MISFPVIVVAVAVTVLFVFFQSVLLAILTTNRFAYIEPRWLGVELLLIVSNNCFHRSVMLAVGRFLQSLFGIK